MKQVHVLGICGTFMGGIAQLAKQAGFAVSGSDAQVYPPMSTQLEQAGIVLHEGFDAAQLEGEFDDLVVGNVMARGKPIVEAMLNKGLAYTSGPQWLAENVLKDRWVLAVSGTHGKTTTSSMLAWILDYAGLNPGFLIGGVPENFGLSARLGDGPFFVVEADEYDTAFFDKRSKFLHYHPRTLIINNLEFDHADIFDSLADIQKQFHHLVRTVPEQGLIIAPHEAAINEVFDKGCWTPLEHVAGQGNWQARLQQADASVFTVIHDGNDAGVVNWSMIGDHNVNNALAAIAAARHAGVPVDVSIKALGEFKGIKRRMQLRGEVNGVRVYDDFAHHPTAIRTTLAAARARQSSGRIIAVLEPRSNTMRMGVHQQTLAESLSDADAVVLFEPDNMQWSLQSVAEAIAAPTQLCHTVEDCVQHLVQQIREGDDVIVMSNGGFGGLHDKLLAALE